MCTKMTTTGCYYVMWNNPDPERHTYFSLMWTLAFGGSGMDEEQKKEDCERGGRNLDGEGHIHGIKTEGEDCWEDGRNH